MVNRYKDQGIVLTGGTLAPAHGTPVGNNGCSKMTEPRRIKVKFQNNTNTMVRVMLLMI